jgi:hypothetical protein
MKRIQWGVLGIACAMTVGLSAQEPRTPPAGAPQSPAPSQAPAPSADKADNSKVTVTGCLAKGSGAASPTGTSGGAAAGGSQFVLNDVKASGAAPTAGTSGAAASIASSYRLDADESKLTPHVGHKVEISGTVDKAAMGDRPAGGAAPSSGGPKLKVDNVKMIAASCTP